MSFELGYVVRSKLKVEYPVAVKQHVPATNKWVLSVELLEAI
jgi:hypothetical protein